MHTGFIAHYESGSSKKELDYYVGKDGKLKATNWHEVNLDKLTALELVWRGESKITIRKEDHPGIKQGDWYFTCSGTVDIKNPDRPTIIARNIGYRVGNILHLFTVEEASGILRAHTRREKNAARQ